MAISVKHTCANLVMIVGTPRELFSGNISEQAIGAAETKLASYYGTASEPFKAILKRYHDRLVPIGGCCLMEREGTTSTFPITITNLPSNPPFVNSGVHNQFQYFAQAIDNKPKFDNKLYLVFMNMGGNPTRGN